MEQEVELAEIALLSVQDEIANVAAMPTTHDLAQARKTACEIKRIERAE